MEVYFFLTWETKKSHTLFIAQLRLGCAVSFVAGQQNIVRKAKRNNCRDKNSTTEFSVRRLRVCFQLLQAGQIVHVQCFKAHMNPMSFWYHAKMSQITSITCYVILLVPLECSDCTVVESQVLSGEALNLYRGNIMACQNVRGMQVMNSSRQGRTMSLL